MKNKKDVIEKYKKTIQKISEDLANEILNSEDNLETKFFSLDLDVIKF